ncbi:MAG: AsnC family transcriptional regulator [Candidatus Micrarchaeia archaeon]
MGEENFHSSFNDNYSLESRKILRLLSQDARISISQLSKNIGISRLTVAKKLKKIDETFSLKYTLEINEAKLGLANPHIIWVKFKETPDYSKILPIFQNSYIPQVVAITKGDYDLLIYAVSPYSTEYAYWEKNMQILLSKYGVIWRSSWMVHRQLGFFPLRRELLEKLDIEKKYKSMLILLNENSRIPFHEIAGKLGIRASTSAYRFEKLMKSGYINRATIVMRPSKINFTLMSFFARYTPSNGYEESSAVARKAFMSDDKNSAISRYLICAPLIGSYDFFTLGAFDNERVAIEKDIAYHKSLFKNQGIHIKYATVERMLIGSLPIRSIDTTKEYKILKWAQ